MPLRGVRWNCHAPARHGPTAVDVKHVAHPSTLSLTVPFTPPCVVFTGTTHSHYSLLEEKARGEGDGGGGTVDGVRGRWWCSSERSGVTGTRAVEGNARFIYRIPSLILFPSFLPVRFLDPFLEIPAIRRCAGVPAGAVVVC